MSLEVVPCASPPLEGLRALIHHPSLAGEFEKFAQPGSLEDKLADPFLVPECACVGLSGGAPAGFALVFAIPIAGGGAWAAIRLGVAEPFRRRGLGSAILGHVLERLGALKGAGGIRELGLSAFMPNDAASGFAARHGFEHSRWYWRMEREARPTPEVRWPPGIEVRMYDGNERSLEDWDEAYNDSFALHYHFVPSTPESLRRRVRLPNALADGVLLAYRGKRCVGFCRNERLNSTGVIGILGTVREARGIGLGRALLRWAIASFGGRGFPRVGLMVDGENEGALALYRSEGFEITRTRRFWSRTPNF